MHTKIRIGDEVFSEKYGQGVVIAIDKNSRYPIVVKFALKSYERYTYQGDYWDYGCEFYGPNTTYNIKLANFTLAKRYRRIFINRLQESFKHLLGVNK